jgi:hypothetical protein
MQWLFLSILNASASAGALDLVKEVHSHALKTGLESAWIHHAITMQDIWRKLSSSSVIWLLTQMEQLGEPCSVFVELIIMWELGELVFKKLLKLDPQECLCICAPFQHLCSSWQVGGGVLGAHFDARERCTQGIRA